MMTKLWYQYDDAEKIKNVYGTFTIKNFWEWWQGEERKCMEVRIKDFNLIKEISKKFNLDYSPSGVYVTSLYELKTVMANVRDKATIWFGINPRKKNWNRWGSKSYGGSDTNVSQIDILFIDIDRVEKTGVATNVDLENCDILANHIIARLKTQGWGNNYLKVCSGNGVQLLIKFDIPIMIPDVEFDSKLKMFLPNSEYEKTKKLIREGIGGDLKKFCNKYKKDLGVEVDKSCFNLSRVGALPFTKNFKYGGFTWRGIVELKGGVNDGFSDYVLSKEDNSTKYREVKLFVSRAVKRRDIIKKGALKENILIRFMLDNDLPEGMRNNYLWFQVKCLLRDSKFDVTSKEFREVHQLLEQKYGGLPMNIPEVKFKFDENIVNSYCIINGIQPIYPLWPKRTKRMCMLIEDVSWEFIQKYPIEERVLDPTTKIIADLAEFKKELVEDNPNNKEKYISFVKGCNTKYGSERTRYFFDTIMIRALSYV